jgi:hypothetical protein
VLCPWFANPGQDAGFPRGTPVIAAAGQQFLLVLRAESKPHRLSPFECRSGLAANDSFSGTEIDLSRWRRATKRRSYSAVQDSGEQTRPFAGNEFLVLITCSLRMQTSSNDWKTLTRAT